MSSDINTDLVVVKQDGIMSILNWASWSEVHKNRRDGAELLVAVWPAIWTVRFIIDFISDCMSGVSSLQTGNNNKITLYLNIRMQHWMKY